MTTPSDGPSAEILRLLPPIVLDEVAWSELLPSEGEVSLASITTLPCAKNIYTTNDHDPRNKKFFNDQFARVGKECSSTIGQMGLHREFVQILGEMLDETSVVVVQPGGSGVVESDFYIEKNGTNAERQLRLNAEEIRRSTTKLTQAMNVLDLTVQNDAELRWAALEWVLGRKIMELAGTACYLRQEYGGFKPGFGGYTPLYMARRTIAVDYLDKHTLAPKVFNTPDVETQRIIDGFGLHMLATTVVRTEVVDDERRANWLVRALLMNSRKELKESSVKNVTDLMIGAAAAHSIDDLNARLRGIFPNDKPKNSNEAMKALSDVVEWEVKKGTNE